MSRPEAVGGSAAGDAGAGSGAGELVPAAADPVAAEVAVLALGESGDGVQRRILTVLAERVGAGAAALFEVSPADAWITVLAHVGLRHAPDALTATEADRELIATDQASLRPSAAPEAGAIAALLHRDGQRIAIAAGLERHGVDQVLVVGRPKGAFDAAARAAVVGVAAILAAVERRQRVADLAVRRLRQQAAVAALGQGALGGGEDLADLAQSTCEAAAANLDAQLVAVLERGPEGLVVIAHAGSPTETLAGELLRWEPLCARVMRDGEPREVSRPGDERGMGRGIRATARSAEPGTVLIVPIRTALRVAGVLLVLCRRPVARSDDDAAFVRSLANVVALATERSRVQAQLRLSVEELRKSAEDRSRLLSHVVQAQEEERQRIADDIHDDSVQVMTAVALRLATLRRRLGGGALDPLLVNLEHDVRQSITRLRRLMFVLRPPALEAHGIAAALHSFLAQVAEDAGLAFSLDDRLPVEPEPEARIVVYRIAQEAVANICKHARAGRIDIALSAGDGAVVVEIRDDGVGFDIGLPTQPPGHLGLLVMRERAEQSGGWFTVESQPGVGTTVRYCVGSSVLRGGTTSRPGAGDGCGAATAGSVAR
jgi:signal transduction histidine kinase